MQFAKYKQTKKQAFEILAQQFIQESRIYRGVCSYDKVQDKPNHYCFIERLALEFNIGFFLNKRPCYSFYAG